MRHEIRYEMSKEVKDLYAKFLQKEISKKEFRGLFCATEQCKKILQEMKALERQTDDWNIEMRPEDVDYCIYVTTYY